MRKAIVNFGYIVVILLTLVSVVTADDQYRQYIPVVAGATGDSPQITPTPTTSPTSTVSPSRTSVPIYTATATNTPLPTNTPTATNTPQPTNTPRPTETVQPTATPTERPSGSGHVKILSIRYDPDGSDVDGEYVRLENIGGSTNMKGWKLHDEAGTTFTFPNFTLAVNAEVKVWTGTGADDNQNLYWNRTRSIWNNDGDTATLKDKNGKEVDTCQYNGGGSTAYCP